VNVLPETAPHGLYAKSSTALAIRGRKVARLVRRLRIVAPWIEAPDIPAAKAYCELELLGAQVFTALMQAGIINSESEPRRLLDAHRQIRQAQLAYARELGLTPAARRAVVGSGKRTLDLAAEFVRESDDDAA
jgi:phage terminase small subunit